MQHIHFGWRRAAEASRLLASPAWPQAWGVVTLVGVSVLTGFPGVAARSADPRANESVTLLWKAPGPIADADLEVSADGKRFAYRSPGRPVVVDGVAGRTYKWVGRPTFSPDGGSVAYAADVGGGSVVVLNGTDGPKYKKVGSDVLDGVYIVNVVGLVFSPDGRRLAYAAAKPKGGHVLVVDGTESAEYDSVGLARFSADGKRIAFPAMRGRTRLLVVDGQERDLGQADVFGLAFSPDGTQLAYATRLNKVEAVTVGDVKGNGFDKVSKPCFSPDGKHVAYMAQRRNTRLMVIDGVEGKPYDWIGAPHFSPDGRRTAYAASRGGFLDENSLPNLRYKSRDATYGVVTDGVEGTWFDGPVLPWIQFSPEGGRLVYWVLSRDKYLVMVDQKEYGQSESPGHLVFSTDGARIAYSASRDPKNRASLVIVDGAVQKEYARVGVPVFSPDARHLAYAASVGSTRVLVIDGREALTDRGFEQLLGGTHAVSAYDLDTGDELTFSHPVGFAFDGSNAINALARKGLEVYRVRIEIGDPDPGAQAAPR
jgi:WD40 repeat protein